MRGLSGSTQQILLGTLLTAFFTPAFALNESRLWLPRTHKQLKQELLAAAQLVEKSPDCTEIISGEMDAERSADDAPVFRIVCRNKAGYTYVVRVTNAGQPDAAIESMPRPDPSQPASSASSGERTAAKNGAAPAQKVEPVDRDSALGKCEEALRRRTGSMSGLQVDLANAKSSTAADGSAQYEINFEAQDPSGEALRFSALCHVTASAAVSVELHPRRSGASTAAKSDGAASGSATSSTTSTPIPASTPAPTPTEKPSPPTDDEGWEVVE